MTRTIIHHSTMESFLEAMDAENDAHDAAGRPQCVYYYAVKEPKNHTAFDTHETNERHVIAERYDDVFDADAERYCIRCSEKFPGQIKLGLCPFCS